MLNQEKTESRRNPTFLVGLGAAALVLLGFTVGLAWNPARSANALTRDAAIASGPIQAGSDVLTCTAQGAKVARDLKKVFASLQTAINANGDKRAETQAAINDASTYMEFPLTLTTHFTKNAEQEFGKAWKKDETYDTAEAFVRQVMDPGNKKADKIFMLLQQRGQAKCNANDVAVTFDETFGEISGTAGRRETGYSALVATAKKANDKIFKLDFVHYHAHIPN